MARVSSLSFAGRRQQSRIASGMHRLGRTVALAGALATAGIGIPAASRDALPKVSAEHALSGASLTAHLPRIEQEITDSQVLPRQESPPSKQFPRLHPSVSVPLACLALPRDVYRQVAWPNLERIFWGEEPLSPDEIRSEAGRDAHDATRLARLATVIAARLGVPSDTPLGTLIALALSRQLSAKEVLTQVGPEQAYDDYGRPQPGYMQALLRVAEGLPDSVDLETAAAIYETRKAAMGKVDIGLQPDAPNSAFRVQLNALREKIAAYCHQLAGEQRVAQVN